MMEEEHGNSIGLFEFMESDDIPRYQPNDMTIDEMINCLRDIWKDSLPKPTLRRI